MFEVCDVAWREHNHHEDSSSFHWRELDEMFGRSKFKRGEFSKLNKVIGMFDVTDNYHSGKGAGDKTGRKATKGYRLTKKARAVKNKYLGIRVRPETELIDVMTGRVVRTPPQSIAAKDKSGRTSVWIHCKPPNVIPVDLDALIELERQAREKINSGELDLFKTDYDRMYSRLNDLGILIRRANTKVAGRGNLMQRYRESDSGRLYAQGINLQKIPRAIRAAALNGKWDYDLENCHYSIFSQLAEQYGRESKAINHYLKHKKLIREQLSSDLCLPIYEIKTCLISIIYGARNNLFPKNAIPSMIGTRKAEQLFEHEFFNALMKDVKKGREKIVDSQEVNNRGYIRNALGKPIKADVTREKVLAHLLQGIEAQALRTIMQTIPEQVILLVHDGFVSRSRVKQGDLEEAIFNETGFNLKLSGQRIQVAPDYD